VWVTSIAIDGVELDLDKVLADVVVRHGRNGVDEPPASSTVQLTLRNVTRDHTSTFQVGVPVVVRVGEPGARARARAAAPRASTGVLTGCDPASGPLEGGTAHVYGDLAAIDPYTYVLEPDGVWGPLTKLSATEAEVTLPAHAAGVCQIGVFDVNYAVIGTTDYTYELPPAPELDPPRFTGRITDASLDDDLLTVIGAGTLSTLGHYWIGGDPWPAERWSERVARAFSEAGLAELVHLTYDPEWDPQLIARGSVDEPPDVVSLLDYLGELAGAVGAAVVDLPDGRVLVQEVAARAQTSGSAWNQVPDTIAWIDVDPALTWSNASDAVPGELPELVVDGADVAYVPVWEQTLDVENIVEVRYGDPEQSVTAVEQASIDFYGPSPSSSSTPLALVDDADRRASQRVSRRAFARWGMTAAPLLRPYPFAIGQVVELGDFPPASPHERWRGVLEGWTDTITGEWWTCELALSDPVLSGVAIFWLDVPDTLTWIDVDPACTWNDAIALDALQAGAQQPIYGEV
jgi:hypothetical protein